MPKNSGSGKGGKNSHPVFRNKETGELATKAKAQANPSKYTKEQMPNRGRGDTGR